MVSVIPLGAWDRLRYFIVALPEPSISRGATQDDFMVIFFRIFEIIILCFVHDVETIFHLSFVLTASGNLF